MIDQPHRVYGLINRYHLASGREPSFPKQVHCLSSDAGLDDQNLTQLEKPDLRAPRPRRDVPWVEVDSGAHLRIMQSTLPFSALGTGGGLLGPHRDRPLVGMAFVPGLAGRGSKGRRWFLGSSAAHSLRRERIDLASVSGCQHTPKRR